MKRNPIIKALMAMALLLVGTTFATNIQAQGIPGLTPTELEDFGD